MNPTFKILIGQPYTQEFIDSVNTVGYQVHCVENNTQKYEQVLDQIGDYDALIAINHKVDKAIMDKATNLKIISNYGVGYDNVDVAYAKEKGIAVTNLPRSTSAPTANLALGLMLSLMRKIVRHDRYLRMNQIPNWSDNRINGNSPENKILGIIGMGRIGKAMAKRATALGMKIWYHNRNQLSPEIEAAYGATYKPLNELASGSDVITIHTPLTASTYHILGREQIGMMKPSAFIVNTARGNVIDHEALIEALENQRIMGASLDVFPEEPIVPDALKTLDNVILTPHIGTGTVEARIAMFEEAFQNVVDFFAGKELEARVALDQVLRCQRQPPPEEEVLDAEAASPTACLVSAIQ